MPAPTPQPSCTTPSIFSDCFASCTGVIDGAAPGPVCGWTYIEPFGALGGQFTFTPGAMSMDTFDADDYPIAAKPLPAPLASVFGMSGQFSFTEYATPPNTMTTYQVILNNADLSETLIISFSGDGSVIVQAGDPDATPTYIGVWTPNAGSHVVHFSIDGAGVPTLYMDGVVIPVPFVADLGTLSALYPANNITYGGGAGDAAAAVSSLANIFLTAGIVGPETVFCCP